MRSEQEVNRAIERYADTVRRLCVVHLKNEADAEDIFQNVFLKYALSTGDFENEEHERAWMIRVTINACKDLLKSFFRSRTVSIDEVVEQAADLHQEHREVLEAVLSLSEKYRGRRLPSLLRRLYGARDWKHFAEETQHDLHPFDPIKSIASPKAGR